MQAVSRCERCTPSPAPTKGRLAACALGEMGEVGEVGEEERGEERVTAGVSVCDGVAAETALSADTSVTADVSGCAAVDRRGEAACNAGD